MAVHEHPTAAAETNSRLQVGKSMFWHKRKTILKWLATAACWQHRPSILIKKLSWLGVDSQMDIFNNYPSIRVSSSFYKAEKAVVVARNWVAKKCLRVNRFYKNHPCTILVCFFLFSSRNLFPDTELRTLLQFSRNKTCSVFSTAEQINYNWLSVGSRSIRNVRLRLIFCSRLGPK